MEAARAGFLGRGTQQQGGLNEWRQGGCERQERGSLSDSQLWGLGDALKPPPWVFPQGDQGTCARNEHF